jgi:hypothetical protein
MVMLFMEGGFSMWFIMLVGLLSLLGAGWFAFRGERKVLGWTAWLTGATAASTIAGFSMDFGKVAHVIAERASEPDAHAMLLQGIGESMSPVILGSALIAAACVLLAIGSRRAEARS